MGAGGSARLPEVPHRALTVFEPFKLSETNASAAPPAEQAAPPLFVARRAGTPAMCRHPVNVSVCRRNCTGCCALVWSLLVGSPAGSSAGHWPCSREVMVMQLVDTSGLASAVRRSAARLLRSFLQENLLMRVCARGDGISCSRPAPVTTRMAASRAPRLPLAELQPLPLQRRERAPPRAAATAAAEALSEQAAAGHRVSGASCLLCAYSRPPSRDWPWAASLGSCNLFTELLLLKI